MHRVKQISKVWDHFPHSICLLRPTQILKIPILMHCVYNLFFHEILQATIKGYLDETHICIFQSFSFHLCLTGMCCSYESKKKWCLERIVSVRQSRILSLWIDDKSWLNVAHAPAIANNRSFQLIVLNKSSILKRVYVDWGFYNFIIQKEKFSVKININN